MCPRRIGVARGALSLGALHARCACCGPSLKISKRSGFDPSSMQAIADRTSAEFSAPRAEKTGSKGTRRNQSRLVASQQRASSNPFPATEMHLILEPCPLQNGYYNIRLSSQKMAVELRTLIFVACSGAGFAHASVAMAQMAPAATPATPPAPSPSAASSPSAAQPLPPVVVTETGTKPAPKKSKKTASAKSKSVSSASNPSPAAEAQAVSVQEGLNSPLAIQNDAFNDARKNIFTKVGANSYSFSEDAIRALPQGTETPVDKLLLQAPGVSQDSAGSGQLHVRNEHANLQYRINGILLPDGVSGFADVLETSFIGNLSLVTGALPAEYGLHTSGLVDITTRAGAQEPGGTISSYGGSRGTFTQSLEYGGSSGPVDYFFTGRYLMNDEGIENPTSSWDAIHDHTEQEKGFGYVSAILDNSTRLSWISGISLQNFQIPNTSGLTPPNAGINGLPADFNSSLLNEHQFEQKLL